MVMHAVALSSKPEHSTMNQKMLADAKPPKTGTRRRHEATQLFACFTLCSPLAVDLLVRLGVIGVIDDQWAKTRTPNKGTAVRLELAQVYTNLGHDQTKIKNKKYR